MSESFNILRPILSNPLSRYICRRDDSPLMPALVGWRRRTISPPASHTRNAEVGPRTTIVAPRPSTWSRWWSRNRTSSDVKESLLDKPATRPETGKGKPARPSLDHTESAPANTVGGMINLYVECVLSSLVRPYQDCSKLPPCKRVFLLLPLCPTLQI